MNKINEVPKDKKLIIFDLDRTLTESKAEIDEEMSSLLAQLLKTKMIAVIGGGKFEQFKKQLLSKLSASGELLANVFLFPVTATTFFKYQNNEWAEVYSQNFSNEEREEILSAFEKTFRELNYKHPATIYETVYKNQANHCL